ncbi:3-phosphoshikimate 1-carboxyvinyltransferase [Firmicutes bacterium AM43-11BH]|uniref:3-phosphoshikimate 1-carboxyvinyltransferase n=1 Tax=Ruminococcus hominis TaxID=2763065 RepID=A0ABR7G7K5_9FIRM|nr:MULTISPECIES: 3-phosphoshikimate 1-carboxyvinyltransferase [Clostridia]MBC5683424.1 3-phosphoshikimate 1-carboxyvinyltransferase [Ruminococcus hominis]MCH4279267.1 3-phosphoshikimate 1-carboxyvinyltransferase [Mediterraneibacter sp. NSJ-151]RHS82253.1 3-phosphoshikimate 1-carboxyvinyltransferase [Firmicutes bacterium AM43-11BH]
MELAKITGLRGEVNIPGDKSISHRCIMFGSIASGTTEISNFLQGADCLATINCFRRMGIEIENQEEKIIVHGKGLHGLTAPTEILDVGNSGTTTRLISGILVGQPFESKLSGDNSLNSRPMKRIIEPLTKMGGHISSILRNGCAPLYIAPGKLHGIHYDSPVASAQVKSSILLAGLYADGETSVTEPSLSRNHTELMLKEFGADIRSQFDLNTSKATAFIRPCSELYGQKIMVPGDISSAAYFIAAGLLVPDSEILIKNTGINATRAGILKVCENMGANITLLNERTEGGEAIADILVRTSKLHGTTISGDIIPTLIDEIPIIAIMAAAAEGTTIIKDAAELKVKETNRIETVVDNLKAMGCDIIATDDGMIIHGGKTLHGTTIHTLLDHRIAMAFSIAALIAEDTTRILDSKCVDVSYPTFYDSFENLL